jgi:hypothetical protein
MNPGNHVRHSNRSHNRRFQHKAAPQNKVDKPLPLHTGRHRTYARKTIAVRGTPNELSRSLGLNSPLIPNELSRRSGRRLDQSRPDLRNNQLIQIEANRNLVLSSPVIRNELSRSRRSGPSLDPSRTGLRHRRLIQSEDRAGRSRGQPARRLERNPGKPNRTGNLQHTKSSMAVHPSTKIHETPKIIDKFLIWLGLGLS